MRELEGFMNKLNKLILLISLFIIILFSSFYIKDFRIDASSDSLVAQNDLDFKYFNYYQNIFPSKNSLVIAIESNKMIDRKLLDEIEIITNKIEKLPEISSVFNINKAPILFLNNTSLVDLSNNNYETLINTNIEIKKVLEEFTKSPIYSDQIINNNKNVTSLILFLKENKKKQDLKENKIKYLNNNTYFKKKSEVDYERKILIDNIRKILIESNENYNFYLGGVEMISNDVISFVKSDILVFSFLVISLVLIILFILFKKAKWVFVILLSSIFSVYCMSGLAGFLNFEITAVSANFLSLMFILSISMNIHILNNYLQAEYNLLETIKIMFWPCFYTFLTTVVAFLSLVISDIKPIIDFGIIMIIALFIVLISSFTILPLMISFFLKETSSSYLKYKITKKFNYFALRFKKSLVIMNISLFIISIFGISTLNVENSFIKYFKKNTEIHQGMKLIDTELGGTTPLDIIIKFSNNQNNYDESSDDNSDDELEFEEDIFADNLYDVDTNIWFTDDRIQTIKEIHKFLENRKEIGKVISIYSLINVANLINKNDLSTFELSILYNEIPDNYKEDLIYPYLNIENNMVKISTRVKDSENIKRSKLIDDIRIYTENSFDNIEEVKINGLLVLYNNMLSSLFTSQIKSLGFVLLAIFSMFLILFRSIKLSIIGIIPNILAASFILGLIGLLKIPLDIMTITIAAISIGIAVDNTIHYLYRYKINIESNIDISKSIEITHSTVGHAVLITSLAISLGFLILCFSNFVPTIIFGLFTSLAMIFAMIGVLITLPSILYYLDEYRS